MKASPAAMMSSATSRRSVDPAAVAALADSSADSTMETGRSVECVSERDDGRAAEDREVEDGVTAPRVCRTVEAERSLLSYSADSGVGSCGQLKNGSRSISAQSVAFARGQHVYHSQHQLPRTPQIGDGRMVRSASTTVDGDKSGENYGFLSQYGTPPGVVDLAARSAKDVDFSDDRTDVYQLLCNVLAANPNLKILLWGNNKSIAHGSRQRFAGVQEEDVNDICEDEDDDCADTTMNSSANGSFDVYSNSEQQQQQLSGVRVRQQDGDRRSLRTTNGDGSILNWNAASTTPKFATLPPMNHVQRSPLARSTLTSL